MDNSKLAEALAAAESFLTPGERSVLRDDPSGRMAGFEQEWQRESKLVSLARERERARLRPLLLQCEAVVHAQVELNQRLRRPDAKAGALLGALLADLRAELDR